MKHAFVFELDAADDASQLDVDTMARQAAVNFVEAMRPVGAAQFVCAASGELAEAILRPHTFERKARPL